MAGQDIQRREILPIMAMAATNHVGQTRDVPNLYVCGIMAFTLRTCDHMIETFRLGEHQRA